MVTREELYALVWSIPMTKVADQFGVSGSYMARICTFLNVPRPECQSASNTFHLSAPNTFHFFSPLMLAFALFEPVRIVAGFQNVAVMRDTVQ